MLHMQHHSYFLCNIIMLLLQSPWGRVLSIQQFQLWSEQSFGVYTCIKTLLNSNNTLCFAASSKRNILYSSKLTIHRSMGQWWHLDAPQSFIKLNMALLIIIDFSYSNRLLQLIACYIIMLIVP